MKKALSLILTGAMALSAMSVAAACTGGKNSYPEEEGATVVRFYQRSLASWWDEYVYDRVKEFNEDLTDGIQVELTTFSGSTYNNALTTARENGDPPDIWMSSYGNMYNVGNFCYPLNDVLPQAAFDDIAEEYRDYVGWDTDGKFTYYGYPQYVEPAAMLFYNKDVLKKAGVEKVPETWAEMLESGKKIKSVLGAGQYVLGLPTGANINYVFWGTEVNATGDFIVDGETWQKNMLDESNGSTQKWKDLLGYLYDLHKEGLVPVSSVSSDDYNNIVSALCDGKLAMTYSGSWGIADVVNDYPELIEKVGVAPIPTPEGNYEKSATNGGWALCLHTNTKNPDHTAAAAFLKWYLTEDVERSAGFFEAAAYSKIPTSVKVGTYIDENVTIGWKDWVDTAKDIAAKGIAEPRFLGSINTSVNVPMMQSVILAGSKGEDKAAAIDGAVTKYSALLQSIINQNNYTGNPMHKG